MNDKIIFILSNNNMYNIGVISQDQQNEMNKAINKIANNFSMTWESVGIEDVMDIADKLESYTPIDDKSILKCMVMNKHIKHTLRFKKLINCEIEFHVKVFCLQVVSKT